MATGTDQERLGRRWRAGWIIAAVLATVTGGYALWWTNRGFPGEWRLIAKGMTQAQVDALIGGRGGHLLCGFMGIEHDRHSLLTSLHGFDLTIYYSMPGAAPATPEPQTVVFLRVTKRNRALEWAQFLLGLPRPTVGPDVSTVYALN